MALHEDLRKTHLPPDTLRAILSKQIGRISDPDGGKSVRWKNVVNILDIMERTNIRGKRDDLETIILKAIDTGGVRAPKISKHDTLLSVWNALVEAHIGRLQNIGIETRERWLMYRLRELRRQFKQKSPKGHVLAASWEEWQQLASQGFFQGIALPTDVTTVRYGNFHDCVSDIIETLRVIHDGGGIIPLEALRSVWWNHLESRVANFDPPDIQTYEYISRIMEADDVNHAYPFDRLVRKALDEAIADVTGGVNAISLLLYLPSPSKDTSSDSEGNSCSSYEKALHFARRRIKHIPTQPTEAQAQHIVTTLGFGTVLVKDAITQGEDISENLILTIFRGFKFLPWWLRTDDRHIGRIQSALLLLVRSLRKQDHTLIEWKSSWPTMLDTLRGYSSNKEILSQTMSLYRRMRNAKDPAFPEALSSFRQNQFRNMLDSPWIAMELYVDAIRAGSSDLGGIREAIVQRLSAMKNPTYLRHLRTATIRYRFSDEARSIVLELLHDAIDRSNSPDLIIGLYDMSSEISTPDDALSGKILHLLLCKMKDLGDGEHRQLAVKRVEAASERGIALSQIGKETLASLVGGEHKETSMEISPQAPHVI
ncbi:hypothetical protein QFC19_006330 [Naganishia cerealis]|uniref:Uncharacterized protein n=1 Tax=Naganishia cerealis TaxID=610337 RepID=A0ACC2VHC0_9TREE|nr:hypothetical protein QFC19_006330 [Naganishia cerealis]